MSGEKVKHVFGQIDTNSERKVKRFDQKVKQNSTKGHLFKVALQELLSAAVELSDFNSPGYAHNCTTVQ